LALYPFERFSHTAKLALTNAQREAEQGGQSYIGTEHLVIALIETQGGLAAQALRNLGVQGSEIRASVKQVLAAEETHPASQIIPTSRVKRLIEMSFDQAMVDKSSVVDTGHMLIAMVIEGEGIGAQVLRDHGATAERVKAELGRLRSAGMTEPGGTSGRHAFKRHHLDVVGPHGKPVTVDILFSVEYTDQECAAILARVRAAIQANAP
jgi:ATP-dependent Clp protease ATP-binding subunit ClpC